MRNQTSMKDALLCRHLAVTLLLVGALGCKDGFNVGTTKPDSVRAGGQVGNPGTGGSVGGEDGGAGAAEPSGQDGRPEAADLPMAEPDGSGPETPTSAPGADGGIAGAGGATSTDGLVGAGGTTESGGTIGAGGATGAGGKVGAGGAGSSALGKACTTSDECPADAICCDGSAPFCDGTLLPAGDGADPGELVVSGDGLAVTDTVTGLVWQRDGSGARPGCSVDGSLRCTWPEAQAYCASLVLGGVSGWRLPGWKELFTITDLTKEPGIATVDLAAFPDTPNESFWAFQGLSGSSSSGQMYVDFSNATVDYTAQASLRVRCVRGARCYPKVRFVVLDAQDNADGLLVRDALTGLVWQQLTDRPPPTCRTWADAQSYCASLGPGFRLPTLKEMHTILTAGLILDRTFFQTSECKIAWTSSPYGGPDLSATGYARVRDEVGMNPYDWNRLDWLRGIRCVR